MEGGKKITIIVLSLLVVILVVFCVALYFQSNPKNKLENRACTLEAKICPDGAAVGRTGPNCEFAACPESVATTTATTSTATVSTTTASSATTSGTTTIAHIMNPKATSTVKAEASSNSKSATGIKCNTLECFSQAAKTCSTATGVVVYKDMPALNFLFSGKTQMEIKKGDNGMCVLYQKYLEASIRYSDKLVQSLLDEGKTMIEIKSMETTGNQQQQIVIGKDLKCTMTVEALSKSLSGYYMTSDPSSCTGTLMDIN